MQKRRGRWGKGVRFGEGTGGAGAGAGMVLDVGEGNSRSRGDWGVGNQGKEQKEDMERAHAQEVGGKEGVGEGRNRKSMGRGAF